jgi:hypothetical protein
MFQGHFPSEHTSDNLTFSLSLLHTPLTLLANIKFSENKSLPTPLLIQLCT